MRPSPRFSIVIVVTCLLLALVSGCAEQLRFAPTEAQKQVALQTHMTARAVDENGAYPGSPATQQLVMGTETALSYIGAPMSVNINDYESTLAQARQDAAQRPTSDDVFAATEQGLDLASELAILFGVGGVGFGGKKLLDWIKYARQKSKALEEIVKGNELFKKQADDSAVAAFKTAQSSTQMTPSTKVLVTELKG